MAPSRGLEESTARTPPPFLRHPPASSPPYSMGLFNYLPRVTRSFYGRAGSSGPSELVGADPLALLRISRQFCFPWEWIRIVGTALTPQYVSRRWLQLYIFAVTIPCCVLLSLLFDILGILAPRIASTMPFLTMKCPDETPVKDPWFDVYFWMPFHCRSL